MPRNTSDFTNNEKSTENSKSIAEVIEEKEETVKEVFGKKYNFEVTIDPLSKSGLKGLPQHIEERILGIFKKEEIIADPEKVLQCIIEAQVINGTGQFDQPLEDQSVKRHQKYNLPEDSEV